MDNDSFLGTLSLSPARALPDDQDETLQGHVKSLHQYAKRKWRASIWGDSKPLEAWEAALESWIEFNATGYSVNVKNVQAMLPTIANTVPRLSKGISQLFEGDGSSSRPMFMLLLRPIGGKVYFLYFWKAFGEAMHMTGAAREDCLTAEIETVRDRLLRCCEERTNDLTTESRFVFGSDVKEEVEIAASMSAYPGFWKRCSEVNSDIPDVVTIEVLTVVLLEWLHESTCWQFAETLSEDMEVANICGGSPVYLHIYDVSKIRGVAQVNRILCPTWLPVKFGGVFHAGVEVDGLEWCYGFSVSGKPGVVSLPPRRHPHHKYRETIKLGVTEIRQYEINQLIFQLKTEYPGEDYHFLRRNCCHFADDFCGRLGVGGIPSWVHRLARLAAGVEAILSN